MMKKLLVAITVSLAIASVGTAQAADNQVSGSAFTAGAVGALLAPTPIGAIIWFGVGIAAAIATYKSN